MSFFPISLAVSFAIAFIGYALIYCLENDVKAIKDLIKPSTNFSKKNLYLLTAACFLYFGVGCLWLLFGVAHY